MRGFPIVVLLQCNAQLKIFNINYKFSELISKKKFNLQKNN